MYVTCNMEYTYCRVTILFYECYHWLDILHVFFGNNVLGRNNDTPCNNISQLCLLPFV